MGYFRIARAIKSFGPDVVHFPLSHPWNAVLASMLGSIPLVFTIHDPVPHTGAQWRRVTEVTHHFMYQRASRIVALCHHSLNSLPERVKGKAVVIPHPAFEHYRIDVPPSKPDRQRVIFFGRLEPYKGLEIFCESAEQLRHAGVDVDFIIAGPGDLSRCLQGKPPTAVTVINRFLSEREVSQLLASASLLVLPYTDGTQSGVLAAAYAAGLPVVATTVGSFPEFVHEEVSGLLVPPNDSSALASAIRRVLLDPILRKKLSRGADELARTTLSWGEVTARHVELYRVMTGQS
jgi:glycosyltransferase involved in cell wall biosynthesis